MFYCDSLIWNFLGTWRREGLNITAMGFIGAEPESAKYQKWLLILRHLCNLPELVFAHSALGSTRHVRIPVLGSWHQFQLTVSYLIPVQQLVTSSTRYEVRDDNILVTILLLSPA